LRYVNVTTMAPEKNLKEEREEHAMRRRLCAAVVAVVAIAFPSSGSAAPPLPCSNYATVAAWASAGSCVDNTDGDLLLTYVSSSGAFPPSAAFSVAEVQLAGADLYIVGFDFGVAGWTGGGGIQYSLTSLNQERIASASLDTVVQGAGAVATKTFADVGGGAPFLTLTSANGARDPANGETPFAPRTVVLVSETFNLPGTAVFFHADNTAGVVVGATTVPVDSGWALASLALLIALAGAYRLRGRSSRT
jgi:hypothetical protein